MNNEGEIGRHNGTRLTVQLDQVSSQVFSEFSRLFEHVVSPYSFCVAWDSPRAEGLEEGADRCQEVFQSCDLRQANRTLCHLHQICYQENTSLKRLPYKYSPKMRAAISLLFCEGISLTTSSAVRPFWSTMFTSIPVEWQATVMSRLVHTGTAHPAVSSDLHWGVSAPRPSSQTRLLHGERCLSLSEHKNRGHKYAAMQLRLYIYVLPQNCVKKEKSGVLKLLKNSGSSVKCAVWSMSTTWCATQLLHGWEIRAFSSSQNHANCNLQIQGLGDPAKSAQAWFRQREHTKAKSISNILCKGF